MVRLLPADFPLKNARHTAGRFPFMAKLFLFRSASATAAVHDNPPPFGDIIPLSGSLFSGKERFPACQEILFLL